MTMALSPPSSLPPSHESLSLAKSIGYLCNMKAFVKLMGHIFHYYFQTTSGLYNVSKTMTIADVIVKTLRITPSIGSIHITVTAPSSYHA